MATSTQGDKPLEQHITCNVCLDVYNDPHALTYLHTYCKQCIQGLMEDCQIKCPECREYTKQSHVKKDFKMKSLITISRSTSEKDDNPQETVCDLCKNSKKAVQSFCRNCEELMCADCFRAHRGRRLTTDHTVITFTELQQSQKQELDKYNKFVRDTERDVDSKRTSNRELIENIKQAEVRQMAEVNRLRQSILDDVNSHHDSLLAEIQSINQNTITSLEQQGQMFTEAKQQLAGKKQLLADVSQTHDISVLTKRLKKLSKQLKYDVEVIRSKLPRFDRDVQSKVQVVTGMKWDPGTSTRIKVAGSVAARADESRYHKQRLGRNSGR